MQPLPETPFGDISAFHEAFSALYPRLVSYAKRYGSTFPEDVAQEAFVVLMKREEPVEHPTAFLYGTVRTLALTERRPMKNQNLSLESVAEPSRRPDADEALLGLALRRRGPLHPRDRPHPGHPRGHGEDPHPPRQGPAPRPAQSVWRHPCPGLNPPVPKNPKKTAPSVQN